MQVTVGTMAKFGILGQAALLPNLTDVLRSPRSPRSVSLSGATVCWGDGMGG